MTDGSEVERWKRIAQRIDDDADTVRENLERERDEALTEVERLRTQVADAWQEGWDAAGLEDERTRGKGLSIIWKYPIPLNPGNAVHEVPGQARLVHVEAQHGEAALWYEVPDPDALPVHRRFSLFITGEKIPEGWTYCGTTLHDSGSLVLHVYEAATPPHA